jgi:transcriptional regulator with XRE-family HTH domain
VRYGRRQGLRVDADRVRAARLAAGLSLADVAGDDLSRTMVHFVERGRAKPSREVLRVIARRTRKPISYFLLADKAGGPDSELAKLSLAQQLSSAGIEVRRFLDARRLSKPEREAMTLVEVAIRQAAVLVRSLEKTSPRRRGK